MAVKLDRRRARANDELERRLDVLEHLLAQPVTEFRPRASPRARLGHACRDVDNILGVAPGQSLEILDELVELGLLQPVLCNRIHTCSGCRHWPLNFREVCPACGGLDLEPERMLLHFRCAYVGGEREYRRGFDLCCPKCNRVLQQLGQDFERRYEVVFCRQCEQRSDEARIEVECLRCGKLQSFDDVECESVFRYRATALASRAVSEGRLTGLDLEQSFADAQTGFGSRTWFELQLERECVRGRLHGAPFAVGTVQLVDERGQARPLETDQERDSLRALSQWLRDRLRALDLMCRWNECSIGLLLPDTDPDELSAVQQRLDEQSSELEVCDNGERLVLSWRWHAATDPNQSVQSLRPFLDGSIEPTAEEVPSP